MTQEQITRMIELKAKGLNYREIGDQIGITPNTVARYINNKSRICQEWDEVVGKLRGKIKGIEIVARE